MSAAAVAAAAAALLLRHGESSFALALSAPSPTSPRPRPRPRRRQRVVVVGAGVGGLATAARVASASARRSASGGEDDDTPCEVIVLEKNADEDMVGGRCGSFDVEVEGSWTGGGGGRRRRFRHERGPSLLLLREAYEDVFRECSPSTAWGNEDGSSSPSAAAAYYGLEMKPCVPAYRAVFEDGDSIDLGFPADAAASDPAVREAEVRSRAKMDGYEKDGSERWDEYMRATSAFLDCGLPNFIEERLDLPSFPAFLVEALRDGARAWPLRPHSDVLDATFRSDKMRALASFQDLYVGLEPYRNPDKIGGGVLRRTAPAVFGLLAALELHPTNAKAGVFAPVGGFRAVGKAFRRLADDCGVAFRFGCTVTAVTEGGVHYHHDDAAEGSAGKDGGGGGFLPADVVVINADLPFATETLLKGTTDPSSSSSSSRQPPTPESSSPMARYDWDDSFDYSSGVVAFHWSVSKVLRGLNTHNVFLSATSREAAKGSWAVLRDGEAAAPPPAPDRPFNFYVHCAGDTDPTAAPEGCDSVMVLVPCRTLLRDGELADLPREEAILRYKEQFDETYLGQMREAVLSRMGAVEGLEDLDEHILDEVVDTPASYADSYNLAAGTPFALSHGFLQLSLTRPGAQATGLDNALFVGASSRPGNGVPLVLLGAKALSEKVLKKLESLKDEVVI